ncbi:MAG: mevalonate kinase [Thermoprotei archaeon]|nr:MAG: mevalonate kinase [Thermoprotei archaeon]
MQVEAKAPGKVIITGEHFVVENEPGVAAAVSLYAKVNARVIDDNIIRIRAVNFNKGEIIKKDDLYNERIKVNAIFKPFIKILLDVCKEYGELPSMDISIFSDIPAKSGLGSSAATATAFAAAILRILNAELDLDKVSQLAYEAEKITHGKPSGIDNTVSTYGGVIVFRKTEGFIKLEDINYESLIFILADSGSREETKILVEKVRKLRQKYEEVFVPFYHAAGHLSIELAKALREGNILAVGELMNISHGMLYSLGLSTEKIEELVFAARKAGALGAKITGAGGGGMILALVTPDTIDSVQKELKRAGATWVKAVRVEEKGVLVNVDKH